MPIHTSFRSLINGMKKQYAGTGKTVCRKLIDGSQICASEKAWQVFYSYVNKKGWDEERAMPKKNLSDLLIMSAGAIINDT